MASQEPQHPETCKPNVQNSKETEELELVMALVVTGAAGLIGSHFVEFINKHGHQDVIAVDDLTDGHKFVNLRHLSIIDYLEKDDFLTLVKQGEFSNGIDGIIHLGACSATTEWDGRYLMKNNYEYSKILFNHCTKFNISMIYASSAAVYGDGENGFRETQQCENPKNAYAFSKVMFDNYVRQNSANISSQVVGLRFFNVYGPQEQHKGSMASTIYQFNRQILEEGRCALFGAYDGFEAGAQMRDFIYVEDCSRVISWLLSKPTVSGIFNLGTGQARPFIDVATAIQKWHSDRLNTTPKIEFIDFPDHLKGRYQSYTEADMSALRAAGYNMDFMSLEDGIFSYLDRANMGS